MKVDKVVPDLRRAALSGARRTALARLVAEASTLASSVVLARLIPPAEFGRAAVALIVIALAAVLGTAGLVAPIVQRRELHQRHVASATFLALAVGLLLAGTTALFGVFGASAIFDEKTARLIFLASPVWLLTGIGAASQALLQRELRFGRQAVIEAVAMVASVSVTLAAALEGLNGDALVIGALTYVGSTALLSLLSAPPGVPHPYRREIRQICAFAAPVAGSSLAYLGYRNVDYAILGAQASPVQVGFYWRAFQLGVGYQGKITRVMLRISLPLYSRASGVEQLSRMRMRIVRTHATVLIPLLAMFIGIAPVLIPWLYGAAWEPTVIPAQILAVAGMADAVMTGSGPAMVALGRPGALMTWNLAQLVSYALLIAALAPHGITVVAVGVTVFGVASTVAMHRLLLGRYLRLSLGQLWLDVRAGIITGTAILATATGLRAGLKPLELPDPLSLPLLGLAAIGTGGIVLKTAFRKEWDDIEAITRRARPAPATSVPPTS